MTEEMFENVTQKVEVLEDGKIKVGENTYATPEAVYEGKLKADEHINIIQAENKELTERLQKVGNQDTALEEILTRLEKENTNQQQNYDFENSNQNQGNEQGEFDPSLIKKMVKEESLNLYQEEQQRLQKEQMTETIKTNQKKIEDALIERTGSPQEAKEAWENYKKSSSYDEQIYQLQVLKTPDTLIDAIVPSSKTSGQQTVNFSGVNIPKSNYNHSKSSVGPKPRSYYAEMMKKDSRKYWAPENQIQMKQDMASMGTEVFLSR